MTLATNRDFEVFTGCTWVSSKGVDVEEAFRWLKDNVGPQENCGWHSTGTSWNSETTGWMIHYKSDAMMFKLRFAYAISITA